jgi:hypothetical protein
MQQVNIYCVEYETDFIHMFGMNHLRKKIYLITVYIVYADIRGVFVTIRLVKYKVFLNSNFYHFRI